MEARARELALRMTGHPLAAAAGDSQEADSTIWPIDSLPPADYRGESDFVWQQRCYDDRPSFEAALHAAYALVATRDRFGFLDSMSETPPATIFFQYIAFAIHWVQSRSYASWNPTHF